MMHVEKPYRVTNSVLKCVPLLNKLCRREMQMETLISLCTINMTKFIKITNVL